MKLLMVAIPNHHFFRWVNQLEHAGFKVYWFDISSNGKNSPQISWVKQFTNWKLKWDFPLRSSLKSKTPKAYKFIQRFNEKSVNDEFEAIVNNIKPDIIHCFEMKLSGLPILKTLQINKQIPLIYSSWGSDLYDYENLGVSNFQVKEFLKRVNFLITDCKRDHNIALQNDYKNEFLGVFPGNGGLTISEKKIKPIQERGTIIIKAYSDGVGQGLQIVKALEFIASNISNFKLVIYSADEVVVDYVKQSTILQSLNIKIYPRNQFLKNETLLSIMGQSLIHIASSASDGMPNALLEAMAMGAFPIQSNPGQVTEEVITNKKNGLLIENPLDYKNIADLVLQALSNTVLIEEAKDYNISFINKSYNRGTLQPKIVKLYKKVLVLD